MTPIFPRAGKDDVDASRRGVALITTLAIVVLVSLLLLSFLVLMRLDRAATFSYSADIKAAELGRAALQEITGDLLGEIAAGSIGTTVGGVKLYLPSNRRVSAPAHVGFTVSDYTTGTDFSEQLPATVLQVSRHNSGTYYDAADYDTTKITGTLASAVGTDEKSANGLAIPPARWNKPLLLSADAKSPPSVFAANPPQWVYVTRAGVQNLDGKAMAGLVADRAGVNRDAVLGRYAYVIYDEGALLDMNVAGYPMNTVSGTAPEVRGKGAVAYADLTRVPGLDTIGKIFTEEFVRWRNAGGLARADVEGDYTRLVAVSASVGFMRPADGDSPLLGRRDLLDYLRLKNATAAAPFLGIFSRTVSAPTYAPPKNARDIQPDYGKNTFITSAPSNHRSTAEKDFSYRDIADKDSAINRDLANVRHTNSGTVRHYHDDGTHADYTVKRGEPLLMSRFSLARLAWLKNNPNTGAAPDASLAAAIQACFGLRWGAPGGAGAQNATNGGHPCWNYVGADGAGYRGKIKTLKEVADDGREPDFFELLKAAILNGSLGKYPGIAAFSNATKPDQYSYKFSLVNTDKSNTGPPGMFSHNLNPQATANVPSPAQIPDLHIIQIGANIIDQYDADSYPTGIYFRYDGVGNFDPATGSAGNPLFGPVCMVYGDENLPYLTRAMQVIAAIDRPDEWSKTTVDIKNPKDYEYIEYNKQRGRLAGWIQPEVWNPHQEPAAALEELPRNFQIRAYGEAYTHWYWGASEMDGSVTWEYGLSGTYREGNTPTAEWFQSNDLDETCDLGTINFTDSGTISSFYECPFVLRNDAVLYPNVSVTSPADINVAQPNYPFWDQTPSNLDNRLQKYTNHFVAFNAGVTLKTDDGLTYRPYFVKFNTSSTQVYIVQAGVPEANTFVLGWVDAGGGFHPYSFLTGVFGFAYGLHYTRDGDNSGLGSVSADHGAKTNHGLMDPRTSRFSLITAWFSGLSYVANITMFPKPSRGGYGNVGIKNYSLPRETGFTYATGDGIKIASWAINTPTNPDPTVLSDAYYADPDGVIRPGDGVFYNRTTRAGIMLFSEVGAPASSTAADGDKTIARHGRRPVILNRPFRSVGELGYVFRDLPFKTLDFFSEVSGDAALLDVFTVSDEVRVTNHQLNAIVSGRLNPNNAAQPVLAAVFSGAGKKERDPAWNISAAESRNLAKNIAGHLLETGGTAALANRADLVTTLGGVIRNGMSFADDRNNKAYIEGPVRALADICDFRTWNVMLDVIVQAGLISPSARELKDFTVEAEKRFWLHLAIDRYTGQVVDQLLEPVYE
ncbi:MAG: hypothetical protein LBK60_00705 [Verrucomicrobiales bacterium]|jgi:hypothetical protein|nr:hypothetical protein [Verrucomicrobiales bacterium]